VIGPNGAGKTTLFGIAAGTVAPDSGRVMLAGADVTRLPPERRCRAGSRARSRSRSRSAA
jgi:branched-chain amino acid transport system ATP-binding protein